MSSLSPEQISEILASHLAWLQEEPNGKRADLSKANLYGADLSGANLYGADLSRADLSRANLCGADLSRADLSGANLYGADLSGANLCGADLSRANLYDANLSRADLSGADLSGANLYGATNARVLQIGTIGSRNDILRVTFPPHTTDVMLRTGCFYGSRDEFAAVVEKTHGNSMHGRAYRGAIALIDTMAGIYDEQDAAQKEAVSSDN